jgi:hypothetical protein
LKKIKNSSHKLPKQQSTSFWSQGILGVNPKIPCDFLPNFAVFDIIGKINFLKNKSMRP